MLVKIRIPKDHYEGFTGYYFKYGKRNALEITTMGLLLPREAWL